MKQQIAVIMCSVVLGLMTVSSAAMAQQKTAKECREEWKANKAANQANGVTEKVYVAQCRGGAAPAQPTAAPGEPPAPKTATSSGQKTAKECREEWKANKAANQANGVTEKAYLAQCRGGAAPAQTTTAPAPPSTPTAAPAPTAAAAGQKTAKECREEWRANKAANQADGVTEKAYVAQCRGGAPAQTTTAPAPPSTPTAAPATPNPAPTASPATPSQTPTAAAPPSRPAPPSTASPAPIAPAGERGPNEFPTEAQARARCPTDTVVWVNLTSKIYHFSGAKSYGTTKHGAYECERDATAAGMRAAKNETHP